MKRVVLIIIIVFVAVVLLVLGLLGINNTDKKKDSSTIKSLSEEQIIKLCNEKFETDECSKDKMTKEGSIYKITIDYDEQINRIFIYNSKDNSISEKQEYKVEIETTNGGK